MKMKLFAFLPLLLLFSCGYTHRTVFQYGEKQETRMVRIRSSSDTMTIVGRILISDSASGRNIRKIRYRSKIGAMSSYNKKYVTISFDSMGKRTGKVRTQ
jgi:hypothetical protein